MLSLPIIRFCYIYETQKINKLLANNTSFHTLPDFGIKASNLYLYYRNLHRASEFYSKTLGLEMVADYKTAKVFRITSDSYLVLSGAANGMHIFSEQIVPCAMVVSNSWNWRHPQMSFEL